MKKRMEHIWEYYRAHIFLAVFLAVFLWYFILPLFSSERADSQMALAIIDCDSNGNLQTLETDFLDYLGTAGTITIDTTGSSDDSDSSVAIKTTILLSSVGEQDVVICGEELYQRFQAQGAFTDATEISTWKNWKQYGLTCYSPAYLCVPIRSQHPDVAASFLEFLRR